MTSQKTLQQLSWQPFFQQQLSIEEWENINPFRVIAHHRSVLVVVGENGSEQLDLNDELNALTVGDWVLLDEQNCYVRSLERFSFLSRKAAGTKVTEQAIAANINTLFIVCSLNQDFNLNRIERYLTLASNAGAEPVVVLTKSDLCDDTAERLASARALSPLLMVEAVNGLDAESVAALTPWCKEGKTVAFLGSSGVGKSTLVNTLKGEVAQLTGGIRESDAKGKHTTTSRSIHLLSSGGILIDTPGMRELQLTDSRSGIDETFSDIIELAQQCRFSDCQHHSEPGCAINVALENGELDQRRFNNYEKLNKEQVFNSLSLAQKREKDRNLSKMYKRVINETHRAKKS